MQHNQVWSSRQNAAATKIALEAIFVMCCSDNIKETGTRNSFHTNLLWFYKVMTQDEHLKSQYLQFDVIEVTLL